MPISITAEKMPLWKPRRSCCGSMAIRSNSICAAMMSSTACPCRKRQWRRYGRASRPRNWTSGATNCSPNSSMCTAPSTLGEASPKAIGTGPLESAVAQAFKENYLGFRPQHEVRDRMARAEYLVVPSTGMETFGLVVVEAFSCGTPVIASAHGGLADLIADGVTGLLATPGDAAELAAKI